jgi:hypothetical protein
VCTHKVLSMKMFLKGPTVLRNARAIGLSEAAPGEKPVKVIAKLGGHRDPGYWETARMLLESGLCLALQVMLTDSANALPNAAF